MIAKLVINGVDFIPFIVEGGIEQTDVERQTAQVVTLDGTLWSRKKRARGIHVSLRTLRDSYYHQASAALEDERVSVTYTDRDTGEDVTGVFYVLNRTAGVKEIRGGNTYWSGAGFYLEGQDAK